MLIAIVLGLLIYWREYAVRSLVSPFHVILWQIGIWIPWNLAFMAFKRIVDKTRQPKFGLLFLIVCGVVWVLLHYGWFVFLSTTYSPYLGLPESRFGVYRYFFIFWTLIDIGLIWFLIDKLKTSIIQNEEPPLLFELTRGGKTYFCQPSQIQYLTADNYYTKLHTTEGVFVMRKSLKSFSDQLPGDLFMRIHRSTIVNLTCISELCRTDSHHLDVILKDGTRRRVSRKFIKNITLYFKNRTS